MKYEINQLISNWINSISTFQANVQKAFDIPTSWVEKNNNNKNPNQYPNKER